jgi:6-pyruvoyltetrahydropterin/6-carboxytetrahydropterin synthase
MEEYRVRITKDYLVFCAAHFIQFDNDKCECLHGHNYRVAAELWGPLGPSHLVYDFIVLKRMLRGLVDELDHHMLVPRSSPALKVEERGSSIRIASCDKEWIFPREDCVLLPIENTTAERLAYWIACRLYQEMKRAGLPPAQRMRIDVEETFGQSAVYETSYETPPTS